MAKEVERVISGKLCRMKYKNLFKSGVTFTTSKDLEKKTEVLQSAWYHLWSPTLTQHLRPWSAEEVTHAKKTNDERVCIL